MRSDSGYTAFVTGGTGFVGSHLVELLLESGFREVRCLVRNEMKFLEGLPVTVVRGNISDQAALADGVRGVDFVFHVAAVTRARDWDTFLTANVEGSDLLLRTVREVNPGVKKVLVTSSLATVGLCAHPVASEEDPLRPISKYGRSKVMMEERIRSYTADLPIVTIRPPAVYGPRESDIFTFFKTLSKGLCPIIGSGSEKALSLVHARDLVTGMLQAALTDETNGETYFLGSPAHYSWNEIRDATATSLGRRVLTLHVPPFLVGVVGAISESAGRLTGTYPAFNREKAAEARRACLMCDHSKATRTFAYKPNTDLWVGIDETIRWYRSEDWL